MRIWNDADVVIPDIMQVICPLGDIWVRGTARRRGCTLFTWEASPNEHGWKIRVKNMDTFRVEEFQGTTFNLPLEVAAAVRRTL